MKIETFFKEGCACRNLWDAIGLQIEGKASEMLELFENGRGSIDCYELVATRATKISIFRQFGYTSRKPGGYESTKTRLVLQMNITPLVYSDYAASGRQRNLELQKICDCFRITYRNATAFRVVIDF